MTEPTDAEDELVFRATFIDSQDEDAEVRDIRLGTEPAIFIEPVLAIDEDDQEHHALDVTLVDLDPETAVMLLRDFADALEQAVAEDTDTPG